MRRVPAALRRGWALCLLETLAEYRSTYIGVVSARPDYQAEVGVFS